jgi:S-adenosylmethionine hydrolase
VFLSDYGLDDEFVGVCHGVMLAVAPDVRVIDLDHHVPRQDVPRGALNLADSVAYMPAESVYLAVVDPGVGSSRLSVAVETSRGDYLVGPDNGLLSLAWEELGGAVRAVQVVSDDVVLHPVSWTFHGRDVLAPAAANLAAGMLLDRLGPEIPVQDLARIAKPGASVVQGAVECEVLAVDHFGNVQLSVREADLRAAAIETSVRIGDVSLPLVLTFSDVGVGKSGAALDSRGWLALFVNQGSAAEFLGLAVGSTVTLGRGR